MTSLLVTGYKSFELGIFKDKDPKVTIIKKAIKRDFIRYIDDGVDWLIFTGNLGFEFWAIEVAKELQKEYPIRLATIFPFENHGQNWNEANQAKLASFKQVDFVKSTFPAYQSPAQFRQFNQFLIDNTDEAYLFYEPDNETNMKYLYNMMLEAHDYSIRRLTFDDLNDIMSE